MWSIIVKLPRRQFLHLAASAAVSPALPRIARAQKSYPTRSVLLLVGYAAGLSVGGIPGAILGGIVATVAMILPAAMLVHTLARVWQKAQKSRLRHAVEKGLAIIGAPYPHSASQCLLSGVKRTSRLVDVMSAFDPKRRG